MFERVTEAEQEEKQRAFRPGAECRRARRRHEHQGVDLEPLAPQVADRLPDREPAPEGVGDEEKAER